MVRGFIVAIAVFCDAILSAGKVDAQSLGDQIRDSVRDGIAAHAQGALSVLGFTMSPSETASTVSLDSQQDGDVAFVSGQFGGAFTLSDEFPLYLEGFLGYSRYDPDFVVQAPSGALSLPGKWTGFSATGGVGWDFAIADKLVLRPIANLALGYVESDLSVLGRVLEAETGLPTGDFENGRVAAIGYGGSLMLDYEDYTAAREIDVELRYTHLRLEEYDTSEAYLSKSADAITVGLWSRLRVPTGLTVLSEPLRAVGETSFGYYLGDQKTVLDSPWLGQIGAGAEIDFSQVGLSPIRRGRLVGRSCSATG